MLAFVPMELSRTETVNIPYWCDYVIHKIIENYNLNGKTNLGLLNFWIGDD